MDCAFGVVSKKYLLYSRSHKAFSPILSSRSLKSFVLHLGPWSIYVIQDIDQSSFFVLAYGYPIGPILFVEQTILFPLTWLCTFVKNQLSINTWIYFWILNSAPLISLSIFMPIPHCLEYCSFRISIESR